MNYENLSMITITDTNVSITHTFPPLHWYINDRKHINIYENLSMITITDTNITFTHTFPFPFYWILLSEIDRNHVRTWMRTLSRRVYKVTCTRQYSCSPFVCYCLVLCSTWFQKWYLSHGSKNLILLGHKGNL